MTKSPHALIRKLLQLQHLESLALTGIQCYDTGLSVTHFSHKCCKIEYAHAPTYRLYDGWLLVDH